MKWLKIKRVLAFTLTLALVLPLCGCTNVVKEQWEVVEKYRLENTTEEVDEDGNVVKKEITTTEALPEQLSFADFVNEDADTLGEYIKVPNGYVRVNMPTTEATTEKKASKSKKKGEKKVSDTTDATTVSKQATEVSTSSKTSESSQEDVASRTTNEKIGLTNGTTMVEGSTTQFAVGTTSASGENASTTQEATTQTLVIPERDNKTAEVQNMENFMRSLPVKDNNFKLLLYTGEEREKQDSYAAILNLKLDDKNLQQSASSVMRLFAEFQWMNKDFEHMNYQITDNFTLDYSKWLEGYRAKVIDGVGSWYNEGATTEDSYDNFSSYIEYYFSYSGMASLLTMSEKIKAENLQVGDYFLNKDENQAATVVDMAQNEAGDVCFLLAAGGSPGQDIEILKNPAHKNGDPWYYLSEIATSFETPNGDLDYESCYHIKLETNAPVNEVKDEKASAKKKNKSEKKTKKSSKSISDDATTQAKTTENTKSETTEKVEEERIATTQEASGSKATTTQMVSTTQAITTENSTTQSFLGVKKKVSE